MSSKMEVDEKVQSNTGSAAASSSKVSVRGTGKGSGKKEKLVADWPDFNVEKYASQYKGRVKVDRLLHIASVNASVAPRCYEIAIAEVKKGLDVSLYDRLTENAARVVGDGVIPIDASWMASTGMDNDKKTRHLEDEIQRWRNLSNREKICAAYIDAGKFYSKIGSYTTAISRFIEAKSYAGDTRLLLEINLRIITASIQSGNLSHVKSEANHALSSEEVLSDPKKVGKARSATGIYFLRNGRYKNAVDQFVDTSFQLNGKWPEALCGSDIALYGGLCALASYNRNQLKHRVLDNPEFKNYLEMRPTVYKLVKGFYDSEYGSVMSGLKELKRELIVDMYLYNNVESLLSAIRGKALVQYFSPYSTMDLKRMAEAFNVSIQEMENELSTCIADNHIKAKIDSHSKIVYASRIDKRDALIDHIVTMGDDFSRDMKAVLLRMSLQENGCIVSQTRELMMDLDMDGGDDGKGLFGAMARMARGGGGRGGRGGRRG